MGSIEAQKRSPTITLSEKKSFCEAPKNLKDILLTKEKNSF